jgi:hypothetical protein
VPHLDSELTRLLEDVRAGDVELSAALDRFALLLYRDLRRGGREAVMAAVRSAGYAAVEIDERPFSSGSLDRAASKRLPVTG